MLSGSMASTRHRWPSLVSGRHADGGARHGYACGRLGLICCERPARSPAPTSSSGQTTELTRIRSGSRFGGSVPAAPQGSRVAAGRSGSPGVPCSSRAHTLLPPRYVTSGSGVSSGRTGSPARAPAGAQPPRRRRRCRGVPPGAAPIPGPAHPGSPPSQGAPPIPAASLPPPGGPPPTAATATLVLLRHGDAPPRTDGGGTRMRIR